MKLLHSTAILFGLLMLGSMAQASSYLRVVNNSSQPLQANWQAIGCLDVFEDWNGDDQFTVCREYTVEPGEEKTASFSWFYSDRSVKVLVRSGERVGYCNTMDSSSLVFVDDPNEPGGIIFTNNCP